MPIKEEGFSQCSAVSPWSHHGKAPGKFRDTLHRIIRLLYNIPQILTVFCVAFVAAAPHFPLDDGEELDSLPINFEDGDLDLVDGENY